MTGTEIQLWRAVVAKARHPDTGEPLKDDEVMEYCFNRICDGLPICGPLMESYARIESEKDQLKTEMVKYKGFFGKVMNEKELQNSAIRKIKKIAKECGLPSSV